MSITGVRNSFECEKVPYFEARFWKLKKNFTMDFELMDSL